MWKVFILIAIGFVVALLIILGRAFSKDLENYYTKEKYPDPDGKKIGYTFYIMAILIIIATYAILY